MADTNTTIDSLRHDSLEQSGLFCFPVKILEVDQKIRLKVFDESVVGLRRHQ